MGDNNNINNHVISAESNVDLKGIEKLSLYEEKANGSETTKEEDTKRVEKVSNEEGSTAEDINVEIANHVGSTVPTTNNSEFVKAAEVEVRTETTGVEKPTERKTDKKDIDKVSEKPNTGTAGRRSYLRRMNTVASTTPLEFQEFSTDVLDAERRKMNANTINDLNAKKLKEESLSERQLKELPPPEKTPLTHAELFVGEMPDYHKLKAHLIKEGKLEKEAAYELIDRAALLFHEEDTLLQLEAPFTVCGDIHGQFYDLVNLIQNAGDPSTTRYLFLGDYVDRGSFSCEVCFLLFSMKINYPNNVYLTRGNHESRAMTNIHNFKVEVLKKYSEEMYDRFMECFDNLPLAAVLNCKMIGKLFCVHGGLSPNIETLDEVRALNRFREVPPDGSICDLLWSDPVLEDDEMTPRDIMDFREIDFVDNVERGIGYFFGYRAVTQFLLKNDLVSIVRAHEVQQDGCTEHTFTRTDLAIPMVFTVFSAPNYCDYYANKAAYIKFMHNKYEIYQLEAVPHPYWLPDFQNVFLFSIDYVLESVRTMVKGLAEAVAQGEEDTDEWTQEAKSSYMKKLTSLQSKIKVSNIGTEEGFADLSPQERFKIAKKKDLKLEKCSPTRGKSMRHRQLKRFPSSIF